MPVVTMTGPVGAGGNEVGLRVAEILSADYVDRLVFAEAAKRVGATIGALTEKEEKVLRLKDRISHFFQNMLEKSAMSGAAGEPYFGPGIEVLAAGQYAELANEPITEAQQLNDKQFIDATSAVIRDLASTGNVVIIGRGANMILKDLPGAVHVGFSASLEKRIDTIVQRERFSRPEAEKYVLDTEKARQNFHRKFFKVDPANLSLYHLCLNMDQMKLETAAVIVVHAVRDLQG